MNTVSRLTNKNILDVLSLYKNAIAIYTTEDIIIETANDAMIKFWGRDKSVIGKPLDEALPEIKNQPFVQMLQNVLRTGIDDIGEAIPATLLVNGELQTFYFDYEYRAIKNENGETYCIMHTAEDVTERELNRLALLNAEDQKIALEKEQTLNEELAAANEELNAVNEELNEAQETLRQLNDELEERIIARTRELSESEGRLRYMLADAPIAIALLTGKDFIVESANKKVLEAWGKTESILGKPLQVAIPELLGQEFLDLLKQVFISGIPYHGKEVKAMLEQNGIIEDVYTDFVYHPLKNEQGQVISIVVIAHVVTEQVIARNNVQALNTELFIINDELQQHQHDLEEAYKKLRFSESKLDQILSQLPAPVVVLEGPNQVIATTNDSLLRFWSKTKEEVIGRPMLQVFPELKNQPFPAQWKHVLETGETIANREKPVTFNRPNGAKRLFYVDYYYQPLIGTNGQISSVMATVIDVTDKVEARRSVEQAETKLRLAIESSEMGTWYIDAETREFIPSGRLKKIFGFLEEDVMPYEAAINQITEEYRDIIIQSVEDTISRKDSYEFEYPIIGFRDQQLRWVRATGKFYEAHGDQPANFSGTMMDITERKLEEHRKDDFISIASHELKTPITTLKASLQLLDRIKNSSSSNTLPRLVDQANKSMGKITSLIDDLLNSSRTTEGQLHLNKTTFTITEMLAQCCNHIRMEGKYELLIKGDEQLKIHADEHRIDQVVVNIVNNAVKYAPDGKEISLIIEETGDMAKISIKDNGPGIPAERIPHLFDRYYRADHNGNQYSGLGLGLYISSEIIKRHGGQIGVESELGNGSTFWFTLPL